jgi:serine/threonine-protein kinase
MSDFIGKTLSQYQIVELIRETESSTLYKGFQPNMNRYVAVDVLKSHEPAAIQAFTQQNELLVQVQHANILPVYDAGQAGGEQYRAQRFAEGGLLADHLMQYFDIHKAAGMFSGITTGLEQIHAQGLVHGNLQPENIFLDETGQPMLTDFGMPKAHGAPTTPYMSPEQAQGGVVDTRTDIYALGVLLYVVLTGETPPVGVVISPRAKRADLPESVEKVILKAMAQNPDARFQNAHAFQSALTTALQPVVPMQTPASQSPSYQPAPLPARRGPNWAAIILGVILVIVICGGMGLFYNWWSNRPAEGVPGEPVDPPAEVVPTAAPVEPEQPVEPPEEVAPPDDSTGGEVPSEPGEGGQPVQLPAVCSSGGFAGGFFILGSVLMIRKRSTHNRKTNL